jgi:hypothetical protein
MKKMLLFLTSLTSLLLFSCGGSDSNDPKVTLSKFLEAIDKNDIKTAKQYATESSVSFLDMMEMAKDSSASSADSKKKGKFDSLELGTPKIEGDKATIEVKDKTNNSTVKYQLKKEKDVWKVAFDKQAVMEMGKDAMQNGMNEMKEEMNNMSDTLMNLDNMDLPADPADKKLSEQ